jgi:DNA-binding response OmpR family regulator
MIERRYFKKSTSPIDYTSALNRTGGDEFFLDELLNLYSDDFSQKLDQIKIAIVQENYSLIHGLGHNLKGASANLSAIPLQNASFKMEIAGKEKDIKKVKESVEHLEKEFIRFQDFLARKKSKKQKKKIIDASSKDIKKPINIQILVADDSIESQPILEAFMTQAGIELDFSHSGKEAIAYFQKKRYSLIFLDIHMPHMDGFEVIKKMRSFEKVKAISRTPVIALTGLSTKRDKKKCLSSGFDNFIEKPFNKKTLNKTIEKYTKRKDTLPEFETARVDKTIIKLIPSYLKNRRQDIAKIKTALALSDFELIEYLSHNMKGSGSAYGFIKISEFSRQIERFAQKKEAKAIKDVMTQLENYLKSLRYK